jgi:hypothetical protein
VRYVLCDASLSVHVQSLAYYTRGRGMRRRVEGMIERDGRKEGRQRREEEKWREQREKERGWKVASRDVRVVSVA